MSLRLSTDTRDCASSLGSVPVTGDVQSEAQYSLYRPCSGHLSWETRVARVNSKTDEVSCGAQAAVSAAQRMLDFTILQKNNHCLVSCSISLRGQNFLLSVEKGIVSEH